MLAKETDAAVCIWLARLLGALWSIDSMSEVSSFAVVQTKTHRLGTRWYHLKFGHFPGCCIAKQHVFESREKAANAASPFFMPLYARSSVLVCLALRVKRRINQSHELQFCRFCVWVAPLCSCIHPSFVRLTTCYTRCILSQTYRGNSVQTNGQSLSLRGHWTTACWQRYTCMP